MRTRAAALLVGLCLLLTACGASAEPEETDGTATSLLEAASGLEETAVLLTVDGREIPVWRYLCWLAYTCDDIAAQYAAAGAELDWETPVEGGTLADYARDQALADTALYAVVEDWAEAYGCEPTEIEQAEDPWSCGLDQTQLEELAQVGQLYAALHALCRTEDSALTPATEDLAAYGAEIGAVTLDRVLVAAGEDREAAASRAAELFAQLNGAAEQESTFTALAAAGDDPAGPRTLLPESDDLDASLLEAAQALSEDQCSGILESEEGYSILRRLPLDAEALLDAYLDDLLESAAESAQVTVTPAYSALDAADFYEALQRERQRGAAEN